MASSKRVFVGFAVEEKNYHDVLRGQSKLGPAAELDAARGEDHVELALDHVKLNLEGGALVDAPRVRVEERLDRLAELGGDRLQVAGMRVGLAGFPARPLADGDADASGGRPPASARDGGGSPAAVAG